MCGRHGIGTLLPDAVTRNLLFSVSPFLLVVRRLNVRIAAPVVEREQTTPCWSEMRHLYSPQHPRGPRPKTQCLYCYDSPTVCHYEERGRGQL